MPDTEKVALVTGASSGFGEAIAKELGAGGLSVLAAGRNEARTRGVVDAMTASGATAEAWLGDLTGAGACEDLIAACRERFGRLDVLVNSAGVFYPALAEDTSDEEWDETIAVNLTAVEHWFVLRGVPHFVETKTDGSILDTWTRALPLLVIGYLA